MAQLHQKRYWLALLTAILLSMQTLAIWHDAEHAFHDHEEQCDRYEAFANTPALDTVAHTLIVAFTPYVIEATEEVSILFYSKQRTHDAIRAPPQIIS